MVELVYASRYHDFSSGHRVFGHENACSSLHGHNYRIHFDCKAEKLDSVGRVIDFSVIKSKLCNWLEYNWDHKMILWEEDPASFLLRSIEPRSYPLPGTKEAKELDSTLLQIRSSIVRVPFNPTAENMALYLLNVIGPQQLKDTGVTLFHVTVDETRKCSASAKL